MIKYLKQRGHFMKLIINYDLINEIRKANTGFNLQRFSSKMVLFLGVTTPVTLMLLAQGHETVIRSSVFGIVHAITLFGGSELALKSYNQRYADFNLNSLASSLTSINIYTSVDSIKKARLYKTQYKLIHEGKPAIQQNNFIMLPTTGTFNADEISLQQEHIIGSKEYVLSIGEPKKAHSKVFTNAFARQI